MHLLWECPLTQHKSINDPDYESPIISCGGYVYYACEGSSGTDFHIINAATGEDRIHTFDRAAGADAGRLFAFAWQGRVIYCTGDLLEAEGKQVLHRLRMPGRVRGHLVHGHMLIVDCGQLVGVDLDTFTIAWVLQLHGENPTRPANWRPSAI